MISFKTNKESFIDFFSKKWFVITFILIYSVFITSQSVCNPVSDKLIYSDGAIYQYIGHLITIGKMPYVDGFDHKGPMFYLINALSCVISEKWALWFFDLLVMIFALCITYKLSKKFVNSSWAIIINLIIFADISKAYWIGDTPDFYGIVFVALSIYLLMEYYEAGDIKQSSLVLIGICTAMNFWMKATMSVVILAFCGLILLHAIYQKHFMPLVKYVIFFTVGFAIVSLPLIIWLTLNGALSDMVKDYFLFNIYYTDTDGSFSNQIKAFQAFSTMASAVIPFILIFVSILIKNKTNRDTETEDNTSATKINLLLTHAVIVMIVGLLIASMAGRKYEHYILTQYPIYILVASLALHRILEKEIKELGVISSICILCLGMNVMIPNINNTFNACSENWTELSEDTQIKADINQYCDPDDTIASANPDSAGYYLATGHESATTYPYIQANRYSDQEFIDDYNNQIANNKPAVIIWSFNWNANKFFRNEVLEQYTIVDKTKRYEVYVHNSKIPQLKLIDKFDDYLDELNAVSKDKPYSVYMSIKDIQGYSLTEQQTNKLSELGFKNMDVLLEKEYHSFIGVINNGEIVYEQVGENEALEYNGEVNGKTVHIESVLLQQGNRSSIIIDSTEYAVNARGFNIVVVDNETGTLIDSVAFDTHIQEFTCIR